MSLTNSTCSSKIKRVVAREGLIIIGILVVVGVFWWMSGIFLPNPTTDPMRYHISSLSDAELTKLELANTNSPNSSSKGTPNNRADDGLNPYVYNLSRILHFTVTPMILVFAYPLYLLIRFIVWAIRTLKRS